MKIFISNSAYCDLEGIKEYYEEQGVSHVGIKFVKSLIEYIQTLVDNPDIASDGESLSQLYIVCLQIRIKSQNQLAEGEPGTI